MAKIETYKRQILPPSGGDLPSGNFWTIRSAGMVGNSIADAGRSLTDLSGILATLNARQVDAQQALDAHKTLADVQGQIAGVFEKNRVEISDPTLFETKTNEDIKDLISKTAEGQTKGVRQKLEPRFIDLALESKIRSKETSMRKAVDQAHATDSANADTYKNMAVSGIQSGNPDAVNTAVEGYRNTIKDFENTGLFGKEYSQERYTKWIKDVEREQLYHAVLNDPEGNMELIESPTMYNKLSADEKNEIISRAARSRSEYIESARKMEKQAYDDMVGKTVQDAFQGKVDIQTMNSPEFKGQFKDPADYDKIVRAGSQTLISDPDTFNRLIYRINSDPYGLTQDDIVTADGLSIPDKNKAIAELQRNQEITNRPNYKPARELFDIDFEKQFGKGALVDPEDQAKWLRVFHSYIIDKKMDPLDAVEKVRNNYQAAATSENEGGKTTDEGGKTTDEGRKTKEDGRPSSIVPPPSSVVFRPSSVVDPTDSLFAGIGKSFMQGTTSFPRTFWGAGAMLEDITKNVPQTTPLAAFTQLIPEGFFARRYGDVKRIEERFAAKGEGYKKYVNGAIRTMSEMLSQYVGTAGLGTLPSMSAGAGAGKYLEARQEGYSIPRSFMAGGVTTATEYVTEKTPLEILGRPGMKFVDRLIKGLIADVPGEIEATLVEMTTVDTAILGKSHTPKEYLGALIDTAATAALTTIGATGVTHPFTRGTINLPVDKLKDETGAVGDISALKKETLAKSEENVIDKNMVDKAGTGDISTEQNPKPEGGKESQKLPAVEVRKTVSGDWMTVDKNSGDALAFFKTEEEALNYKPPFRKAKPSVSDIIESQPETIVMFRGESQGEGDKAYYSIDKKWSMQFTQSGVENEIISASINKSDIYKKEPLPQATSEKEFDEAIKEAKKKGFSAVWFDEGQNEPPSIYVIDKTKLQKAPAGEVAPVVSKKLSWQIPRQEYYGHLSKKSVDNTFKKDIADEINNEEDLYKKQKLVEYYLSDENQDNYPDLFFRSESKDELPEYTSRVDPALVDHYGVAELNGKLAFHFLSEAKRYLGSVGDVIRIYKAENFEELGEEPGGIGIEYLLHKPKVVMELPYSEPNVLDNPSHKKIIKQALREGKPVPPEVLKDYPGLQADVPGAQISELKQNSPSSAGGQQIAVPPEIIKPDIQLMPSLKDLVDTSKLSIDDAIEINDAAKQNNWSDDTVKQFYENAVKGLGVTNKDTDSLGQMLITAKIKEAAYKQEAEKYKQEIADNEKYIQSLYDRMGIKIEGGAPDKYENIVGQVNRKMKEWGNLKPEEMIQKAQEELALNLNRIETGMDVKTLIAATVNTINEVEGTQKETITHEQTIREAMPELVTIYGTVMNLKRGKALTRPQQLASRILGTALFDTFNKTKIMGMENPSDTKLYQKAQIQLAELGQYWSKVLASSSEMGRELEAQKIIAKYGEDIPAPEEFKKLFDMLSGQEEIPAEQFYQLTGMLKNPEQIAEMTKEMARPVSNRIQNIFLEAWINGLLSNPQTHATNFLSNLYTTFASTAERYLASKVHYGNKPGVVDGEVKAMLYGMQMGFWDAVNAARTVWANEQGQFGKAQKVEHAERHAISSQNINGILGKIGVNPMAGTLSHAVDYVGKIWRLPTRALMTADEFFKMINYRMELQAQAYRQVAMEGLAGDAAGERMAELIKSPTTEIRARAMAHAHIQTFTGELGTIGRAVSSVTEKIPIAKIIVPFIRTPENIFTYSWERTPFLAYARNQIRADIKAGGAARDMALGKMAFGGMIAGLAATLAASGFITGGGPDDKELQKMMRDNGWQPDSIRIGDTYYSYKRLDPVGMIIGMVADSVEIMGNVDDYNAGKLAVAIALSMEHNLLDNLYLDGIMNIFEAIKDPRKEWHDYFKKQAGSLIPGGVAGLARGLDPVVHDTKTLIDTMRSRVPGFSAFSPAQRNIFGEKRLRGGSLGNDFISPIWKSKAKNDPVLDEILKHDLHINPPARYLGGTAPSETDPLARDNPKAGVPLSAKQYDRLAELSGKGLHKALEKLIAKPLYQRQSDGQDGGKALLIRQTVDAYRDRAKMILLKEDPELRAGIRKKQVERIQLLRPAGRKAMP